LDTVPRLGVLQQRTVAQPQTLEGSGLAVEEKQDTRANVALLVRHEEVPALVVFGRVMPTIGGEIATADGAVLEKYCSAKALHFVNETSVLRGIVARVREAITARLRRRDQHKSLLQRCDATLNQFPHAWFRSLVI
jgi:hypothetical protein